MKLLPIIAGLLLIPGAALADWTKIDGARFDDGASIVTDAEKTTLNLSGSAWKPVTAYNGSNYDLRPGCGYGIYLRGTGHGGFDGNEMHFWCRSTNTWERLAEPVYYRTDIDPNDGRVYAYDENGDGLNNETPPSQHHRDGTIVTMNDEGLPYAVFVCGSGPAPGGDSSTDHNSRPWYWRFDTGLWHADFIGGQLDDSGQTCLTWNSPYYPTRVYVLRDDRDEYGWFDPFNGTHQLGALPSAPFGTAGYGTSQWIDWGTPTATGASGFAFACTKDNKCTRIDYDAQGNNPVASQVNVTINSPANLNGRTPLKMKTGAWVGTFVGDPAVPGIAATMGNGGLWWCTFPTPTALDCNGVSGYFGPQDPATEPSMAGRGPNTVYRDLHRDENGCLINLSHDGNIWTNDFGCGSAPPPPPPTVECTINVDGVLARTSPDCDDSPTNLDAAKQELDVSSLGPSEGVVWVGDGFHDFTERNVKRVEVRADAENVVIHGLTVKGVRGSNPPIASEPDRLLAHYG